MRRSTTLVICLLLAALDAVSASWPALVYPTKFIAANESIQAPALFERDIFTRDDCQGEACGESASSATSSGSALTRAR